MLETTFKDTSTKQSAWFPQQKLPPKFRSYDAKVRAPREGPGLKEYMEKARSLTREGNKYISGQRNTTIRMFYFKPIISRSDCFCESLSKDEGLGTLRNLI
ncbi:hypothetical protein GCK32_019636 [Trichostrongylus colubriformis]|uniref:Uncharacterized protein n=1 Tax=Trichostrongylus colubriformis TaxID=6319 RepID=A0AAN8INA2_TRICO